MQKKKKEEKEKEKKKKDGGQVGGIKRDVETRIAGNFSQENLHFKMNNSQNHRGDESKLHTQSHLLFT
jgi:hypothetical protein